MATKPKTKPAPKHLGAEGKRAWIKFRKLTADHETLTLYCSSLDRWHQARRDIDKHGILVAMTSDRGHPIQRENPAVKVEATAARIMLSCLRRMAVKEPIVDQWSQFCD